MEPRARVSVWPGRRRVPGIVAPDSWGARGAECLPRDVLRRSSPATSPCDGTTARRCLCHGTGPAPRKHAPPQAVYPRRLMGVWGFCRAIWSIPGRIFGAEHLFAWWTTTTARLTDDAAAMGNDLDPVLCTVGPATAHRRPHAIPLLGRLFATDLPSPAGPTFRLSATELLPFRETSPGWDRHARRPGSGGSTRYNRTGRPPSRPAPGWPRCTSERRAGGRRPG